MGARREEVVISAGMAEGTLPSPKEPALGEHEPGSPACLGSPGVHTSSVVSLNPSPWRMLMHQGPFGALLQDVGSLTEANDFWKYYCPSCYQRSGISGARHSLTKQAATGSTEQRAPKQLTLHTSAARIASGGKGLRNHTDEQRVKIYQEQEELGTWAMDPKVTCLVTGMLHTCLTCM